MSTRTRTAAALLGLAATAIAVPAAAAPAGCSGPYYHLNRFGSAVYGSGYRYCDPPGTGDPTEALVTVQRYDGSALGWRTVASAYGDAVYACTGTATRTYRIAQRTTLTLTTACS